MAKAILEYDLTDPDDKLEFERTSKALDMGLALWEFGYNTKKSIAWKIESDDKITPDDVLDIVYKKFWEIMEEHNINIDKLIQ
jgi:hypothetical protein